VAELVGQNFSHQFRFCDGHSWHRPKPGDRHFTCQTIFLITVKLVRSSLVLFKFTRFYFPFIFSMWSKLVKYCQGDAINNVARTLDPPNSTYPLK
jgi:hypothetical protein